MAKKGVVLRGLVILMAFAVAIQNIAYLLERHVPIRDLYALHLKQLKRQMLVLQLMSVGILMINANTRLRKAIA